MNTSLRLRLLAGLTGALLIGAAPALAMAAGAAPSGQSGQSATAASTPGPSAQDSGGQGGGQAASHDGMLTPPVPGGQTAAKQARQETEKAIDVCAKLGSPGKIDSCLHSRVMVLKDENAMLKAQIAVAKSEQSLSGYGGGGGGNPATKVARPKIGIPDVLSIYGVGKHPLEAVLDYKGGKTLIVHPGQTQLPGGFSVKSITPRGVTLDRNGTPIRLLMTSRGALQANETAPGAVALPNGGLVVPTQMTSVGDQGNGGDQGGQGNAPPPQDQSQGQPQTGQGQPPAGAVVLRPGRAGSGQ